MKLNEFDKDKTKEQQDTGSTEAAAGAMSGINPGVARAGANSAVTGALAGVTGPYGEGLNRKPAYASGVGAGQPNSYMSQLNSLYDQIVGRGPFRYDLNGDMLYRQMADQYTQLGRSAMRNATGTAAGLTGGYGNSYANQVGNQQFQQYLTALNDNIPALYDRALASWQTEGERLLSDYELTLAHLKNAGAGRSSAPAVTPVTNNAADRWDAIRTALQQRRDAQMAYYDQLYKDEKKK